MAPATLQDGAASASRQHDTRNPLSRLTTTLDPVALAGRECSEAAGCRMDGEAPASSKQDGEATACSGINDPLVSPRCLVFSQVLPVAWRRVNVSRHWRCEALMYLDIGVTQRECIETSALHSVNVSRHCRRLMLSSLMYRDIGVAQR